MSYKWSRLSDGGPVSEPAVADTPQPPRADVAIGAFTEHGPWELDLERISWRAAVPADDRPPSLLQPSSPMVVAPRANPAARNRIRQLR